MGVRGATSAPWKAQNVTPRDLNSYFQQVHERVVPLRLAVDVSILFYQCKSTTKKDTYHDILDKVCKKLHSYSELGFVIFPILDGFFRHCSKRDSWKRRTEKLIHTSNSLYNRQKAMAMGAAVDNGNGVQGMAKEINELWKNAVTLENKGQMLDFPHSLLQDLQSKLYILQANTPNNIGGYVKDPIMTKFQADFMIAHLVRSGEVDSAITNDSDMLVLLGPDQFYIKEIKFGTKKNPGVKMELKGGGLKKMGEVRGILKDENNEIVVTEPKMPFFDYDDAHLRVLFAIYCGCDAIPEGVPNGNQDDIWKHIEKEKYSELSVEERREKFTEFIVKKSAKKNKLSRDDIHALSSAILYEPSVDVEKEDDVNAWKYLFGKPDSLVKYVKEFRHPNDTSISIVDGPTCRCCPGSSSSVNPSHLILPFEEMHECMMCAESFCKTCCFHPNMFEKKTIAKYDYYKEKPAILCMGCYKQCSTTKYGGLDDTKSENMVSMREMLAYLHKNNIKVNEKDRKKRHVIQALYDNAIHSPSEYWSKTTKYPVKPSSYLSSCETFFTAKFSNGATFLEDKKNISNKDVIGIVSLLASFVRFKGDSKIDIPFANSLPSFIIDFANDSRVSINETSYKLLYGCQRTVNDPSCPPMNDEEFSFFRYDDGKVGLLLNNLVSASMRKQKYRSHVAFTKEDLLAAKCDCSHGSKTENDRIVCIHTLPLILGVSILFYHGLAQHLLIELANRWDTDIEKLVKKEEVSDFKMGLKALMRAARVPEEQIYQWSNAPSISQMLKDFNVGTEKNVLQFQAKPTPAECIPLRMMNIKSNARLLREKMGGECRSIKEKRLLELVQYESQHNPTTALEQAGTQPSTQARLKCEDKEPKPKSKRKPEPEPKPKVEKKKIRRIEKKAGVRRKTKVKSDSNEEKTFSKMEPVDYNPLVPDYIQNRYMHMALPGTKKKGDEYLGIRVNMLRAKYKDTMKGISSKRKKKCKNEWNILFKDAEDRKTNSALDKANVQVVNGEICEPAGPVMKDVPRAKAKHYCRFPGCKHNDKFYHMQMVPKKVHPTTHTTTRELEVYHGNRIYQQEVWRRLGIKSNDTTKEMRICNCHPTERITRSYECTTGKKKTKKTFEYELTVPIPQGKRRESTARSKGTGSDRMRVKILKKIKKNEAESWINVVIGQGDHHSP